MFPMDCFRESWRLHADLKGEGFWGVGAPLRKQMAGLERHMAPDTALPLFDVPVHPQKRYQGYVDSQWIQCQNVIILIYCTGPCESHEFL